jgi:hypothetical protein
MLLGYYTGGLFAPDTTGFSVASGAKRNTARIDRSRYRSNAPSHFASVEVDLPTKELLESSHSDSECSMNFEFAITRATQSNTISMR